MNFNDLSDANGKFDLILGQRSTGLVVPVWKVVQNSEGEPMGTCAETSGNSEHHSCSMVSTNTYETSIHHRVRIRAARVLRCDQL